MDAHRARRSELMLRTVGRMNKIWAEHKAIPLLKEGMLWLSKGWSVGIYGIELQPFGLVPDLARVELSFLRNAFGIGETC